MNQRWEEPPSYKKQVQSDMFKGSSNIFGGNNYEEQTAFGARK
jgi:hypothetical protein